MVLSDINVHLQGKTLRYCVVDLGGGESADHLPLLVLLYLRNHDCSTAATVAPLVVLPSPISAEHRTCKNHNWEKFVLSNPNDAFFIELDMLCGYNHVEDV